MFCLSKSFLGVIRRFLCSYPLQMTYSGDVNYSAGKHLKGSVSEANCVAVWAHEALEGLWGLICYMVVPKVYPRLVGDSCQCSLWLYQTKHHHFSSLPGKRLWWSQHVNILSASSLSAKGTQFYGVTFENLAGKGHVGPGSIQPIPAEVNGKTADLTRCSNLLVWKKKIKSSIFSLCYYFSVSTTWLSW